MPKNKKAAANVPAFTTAHQNIKQQNWITVYKIYERIKGGSVNDRW